MSKNILLVEDNPTDAMLIIRTLGKGNLANEVILACDGAEALDYLFCKGRYEGRDATVLPLVIILDLKLPKISGLDVLKRMRSAEHLKCLPVVILTSSDEEKDIIDSYSLGANSFISKPVEFNEFTKAVAQLGLYWMILNKPPAKC